MKVIIALSFVVVLAALVSAGYFMTRAGKEGEPKSRGMAKALTVRIGVSVVLFLFILVSYKLGWIQPTGIAAGR